MADLIDRAEIIHYAQFRQEQLHKNPMATLDAKFEVAEYLGFANRLNQVDAVEVVRCRYCKFRTEIGSCGHRRNEILPVAYPDDFCSYGERKEPIEKEE